MEPEIIKEKHWKEQIGNKYLVSPNAEMLKGDYKVLRHMKIPPFYPFSKKEEVLVTFDRDYVISYIGYRIIQPLISLEYNDVIALIAEAYRRWKKRETNNKR